MVKIDYIYGFCIEAQSETILENPCCQHDEREDVEKGYQHCPVSSLLPEVGVDIVEGESQGQDIDSDQYVDLDRQPSNF